MKKHFVQDFMYEFAAETNPDQNAAQDQDGVKPQASDATKNTDKDGKGSAGREEHMIPKHRFDEVNDKYKEMKKQLDALLKEKEENDKKAAEADRLAKEQQGKFEELYKSTSDELNKYKADHKQASDRVKQLEAVINGLLEAKLEAVPEEYRDLLPAHMAPEAKLEWLAQAEKKGLFTNTKKNTPLGESTNPPVSQNTDLNKLSPMEMLRAAYGSR